MGQSVEVKQSTTVGDVLIVDTDRSFTGQDGQAMTPDRVGVGVPALLAERLFALDPEIDHVYVLQNTVTVRRRGGWDEEAAGRVGDTTVSFLRFYDLEEE